MQLIVTIALIAAPGALAYVLARVVNARLAWGVVIATAVLNILALAALIWSLVEPLRTPYGFEGHAALPEAGGVWSAQAYILLGAIGFAAATITSGVLRVVMGRRSVKGALG